MVTVLMSKIQVQPVCFSISYSLRCHASASGGIIDYYKIPSSLLRHGLGKYSSDHVASAACRRRHIELDRTAGPAAGRWITWHSV